MIQQNATILDNLAVAPDCRQLILDSPGLAGPAAPGQFVMVRLSGGEAPFLPRPFSIHRVSPDRSSLEILYKVVGPGTRAMATLAAGDTLNLVGPLGRGFVIPDEVGQVTLAAGGMGVAPLVFLAETLANSGRDLAGCRIFMGGCGDGDILCRDRLAALDLSPEITTEDGSCGRAGLVTAPLEEHLIKTPPDLVCACGPLPMLAAVADLTSRLGIECQVSVETMMACGIGACLGCAVRPSGDKDHYLHACRDGPVFDTREIDLNSLVGKRLP
ncbi:MAG: dihydroorotate dehydrogenase electron transfer subunit [Desulfosudaceae bacterium]